ncbi:hypothetical protein ACHAXH_007002 [Discostella pseudostelligera]
MVAPAIDNPNADNDNSIERMNRSSSSNNSNGDDGADDSAILRTNMKMKPASSSFLDRDFLSFANHNANDNDDDRGMNNDQVENQKNGNSAAATTTTSGGAAAAVSESKKRGRSTSPMPPPPPPNSNATSLNRNEKLAQIDSIPWLALPPPIPPPPPPPLPPPPKQQRDNIPNRGYNNNTNNYSTQQQQHQQQQYQTHQQYYNHYSPPLIRLHNEITYFVTLMSPTPHELELRDTMVTRITKLSHSIFGGEKKCQVLPFGSQVTGLCLPGSDIDFVIRFQSSSSSASSGGKEEDDADYLKQNPLHRFAEAVQHEFGLRSTNDDDDEDDGSSINMDNDDDDPREYLSYLEIIESARVPLVKFTVAPYNLDIDVCFDQPHGPESADLMHRFMESMPPLRPLTVVLKYFLASREINKPFTGGIGSYLLQLMIVSYLQHRAREDVARNWGASGRHYNLGSLLLEFLELYGVDYNYITTGISVRHDGYYFAKGGQDVKSPFWQPTRPFSIAMENPLDPTSDVGAGTFKMQMIQRIFGHAFKTLLAYVSEPYEHTDSILARIIPPTEEMERRMVLKRRIMLDSLGGAGKRASDNEDSDMLTSSSSSNGRSSPKKKSKNKRRKVERNGKA